MQLGNCQVIELSRTLTLLPHLDRESIKFLMRLINVLLIDPLTKVATAWTLFNRISEYAGASLTQQLWLTSLIRLYDVDDACTEKMLKVRLIKVESKKITIYSYIIEVFCCNYQFDLVLNYFYVILYHHWLRFAESTLIDGADQFSRHVLVNVMHYYSVNWHLFDAILFMNRISIERHRYD